jgi:copper chaperone NosL
MNRRPSACLLVAILVLGGCGGADDPPPPIQAGTPCAFCRMTIANAHVAAEVVAPGEEPRQYDDIGCLAGDLQKRPLPSRARAFVADYATGALVPAADAVYTRVESIETPMMSHIVAHATAAARDADSRIPGAGIRQTPKDVFGASIPGGPNGR